MNKTTFKLLVYLIIFIALIFVSPFGKTIKSYFSPAPPAFNAQEEMNKKPHKAGSFTESDDSMKETPVSVVPES